MDEAILRRICREAGMPDLLEALAGRIPATDVQTILLETARRRAGGRSPAELIEHYGRDRTTRPGTSDARRLATLVVAAFDAAPAYAAVAIAPVEPLGLNVVLGGIDQNNVLATVRGTEVVSDPTSALALEAAVRRRTGVEVVRLAACHRVLRLQPFDAPGAQQHFHLHALVIAQRSRAGHAAELQALREHVEAYLRLVAVAREMGTPVERVWVRISDTRVHALLRERGVDPRADVEPTIRRVPGATVWSHIVLKRGVDESLDVWKWRQTVIQEGPDNARVDGNIALIDYTGKTIATWKFDQGWPVKYTGSALNASGNEVALEEVHICHEGLERM